MINNNKKHARVIVLAVCVGGGSINPFGASEGNIDELIIDEIPEAGTRSSPGRHRVEGVFKAQRQELYDARVHRILILVLPPSPSFTKNSYTTITTTTTMPPCN